MKPVLLRSLTSALLVASALVTVDGASAQTYDVLHTFPSCSYNVGLFSSLVQGADGNFYGTTNVSSGLGGTVYRITPAGDVTVLHTFVGGPTDGSNPKAPLVLATDGNFYGTTVHGGGAGAGDGGTLFRMTPAGVVTIMHGFAGGSADGWNPTRLIQASDGNLYGVTTFGGVNNQGTVFRMTLGGAFTLVYSFAGGSANGSGPTTLLKAYDGAFYGMTSGGGATGNGTVFRTTWDGQTTFLYGSFEGVTQDGSTFSGSRPGGDLMQATDWNFYGTIHDHSSPVPAVGSIFKITPAGVFTQFTPIPGRTTSGLIQASDGNLYALAFQNADFSGNPHRRRFIKVTLGGIVSTVHNSTETSCTSTSDAMLQADDGKFYGTTGAGVVYRLSLPPTISLSMPAIVTGRTVVFTANAVNFPGASFQWQVSTDGGTTFTNVVDGGEYSGATSSMLSVTPATTGLNGYLFRVVATNSGGSAAADAATLIVRDRGAATDRDGDGQSDLVVFRPGSTFINWFVRLSESGYTTTRHDWVGTNGDVPVAGDYDADGLMDAAVFRPSDTMWYVQKTTESWPYLAWGFHFGITGDLPVPGDYDGDGQTDIAVFRPSTGVWFVATSSSNYASFVAYALGVGRDIPVPADYDGDGATDVAVYRPSTGTWFVRKSGSSTALAMQWGLAGDTPVPGDYDGDGKADLGVYRPGFGQWYVLLSSTGFSTFTTTQWGLDGDTPVPGDYDGDSKIDPAVFRPSNRMWYILQSSTNYGTSIELQWGLNGDVPVPGDYDGDGLTDPAVYRPDTGEWFITHSSTNYATSASYQWGLSGDITVPGDYDGDGKTDLAVWRPSTGQWFVRESSTGYATSNSFQWGLTNDIPVPADFDGDGKTDVAVWRPSTGEWYLLRSRSNFTLYDQVQWGLPGDIPILKRPYT